MQELKLIDKKKLCLDYVRKGLPLTKITYKQSKNGLFIYGETIGCGKSARNLFTYISNQENNIKGIQDLLDTFIEDNKRFIFGEECLECKINFGGYEK